MAQRSSGVTPGMSPPLNVHADWPSFDRVNHVERSVDFYMRRCPRCRKYENTFFISASSVQYTGNVDVCLRRSRVIARSHQTPARSQCAAHSRLASSYFVSCDEKVRYRSEPCCETLKPSMVDENTYVYRDGQWKSGCSTLDNCPATESSGTKLQFRWKGEEIDQVFRIILWMIMAKWVSSQCGCYLTNPIHKQASASQIMTFFLTQTQISNASLAVPWNKLVYSGRRAQIHSVGPHDVLKRDQRYRYGG